MRILVSACLLGVACRYDGKSKPDERVIKLGKEHELIPVCAEVLGGLDTPRSPAEIINGRAINKDGIDVTEQYERGAKRVLKIARENQCTLAILKSKSPSCGRDLVYDGTFTRALTSGNGFCAELLLKNGIKVLSEEEIDNL